MNPTGYPIQPDTVRFEGLARGLRLLSTAGSSRFAGTGDFDEPPPNLHGYEVRTPRAPREVHYIPGRVLNNEGR